MNTPTKTSKVHHAGLKLCLALILGLLIVPAYVVVPLLFAELESVQAGLIAGKTFHISNLVILILTFAAAVFSYRIKVAKSTWYLLITVAILVVINAFGVTHMMSMIKAEAGDISALSPDEPLRWAFAFWHGMGSIIHLISSLLAVVLVMKGQCPQAKNKEAVA
ncbi:MAG: DUF4149 domain-containing protein [Ghiorsea sp.]